MASKSGGPPDAPTTMWSPSIIVTKRNVTLATAQAQWKKDQKFVRGAAITARSTDGGISFDPNQTSRPGGAQMLYSRLTDTIHAFGLEAPNATSFPESTNYLTWSTSTDDGVTWSAPIVAMDGPGWGAGGGAHLQHGPHRGRLALPYEHASTSHLEGSICGARDSDIQ
jgi:hypothetical protein